MFKKLDLFPQTVIGTIHTSNLSTYTKRVYEIKDSIPNAFPNPEEMYSSGNTFNILSTDPTFSPLKQFIENFIRENTIIKTAYMHRSWVNFGYPLNSQPIHTHPGWPLTGVFYISTPPKCGNLVIHDKTNINSKKIIPIQEGLLVVFDATQPHSVEKNLSSKERIAIPMNFDFVK